jgi:hypothetical protein
MIPFVLALAVLLQQHPVAQRPAPSVASRDSATNRTRQAIMDVGRSVADLRTAHDALRRAVFNFTDAVVIQRAQEMRQSCQDLTAMARAAGGRVCRSCFSASVQPSINGYRAGLVEVGQVGARCARQMDASLRARAPAEAVRRNIWSLAQIVVDGMAPYETRLHAVRRAFGLTDQQPAPRRRP